MSHVPEIELDPSTDSEVAEAVESLEEASPVEVAESVEPGTEYTLNKKPNIKMKIIMSGVSQILTTDAITTVCTHYKFLCVGCQSGRLFILDPIDYGFIQDGKYSFHKKAINEISVTEKGDFLASCGDDSMIFVYQIGQTTPYYKQKLNCPVKTIVISPFYSLNETLFTGDERLLMISKKKIVQTNEELYKAAKCVIKLRLRKNIILWADTNSIRVYDLSTQASIGYIKSKNPITRCDLFWYTDSCFMVGVSDSIRVFFIKENKTSFDISLRKGSIYSIPSASTLRSDNSTSLNQPNKRGVRLCGTIELSDYKIYSISLHQENILALVKSKESLEPFILLIDATEAFEDDFLEQGGYKIIDTIRLSSASQTPLSKSILKLDSLAEEQVHYIATTNGIYKAEGLSLNDEIVYYFETKDYHRILNANQTNETFFDGSRLTAPPWLKYLEELFTEEKYDLCAEICNVLLNTEELWNEYLEKFMDKNKLLCLGRYLPSELGKLKLHPSWYEKVFTDAIKRNQELAYELIRKWPNRDTSFFENEKMIQILTNYLNETFGSNFLVKIRNISSDDYSTMAIENEAKVLVFCLAQLYDYSGKPEDSFKLYLGLESDIAFVVIQNRFKWSKEQKSKIIKILASHVPQMMKINLSESLKLYWELREDISLDLVVQRLSKEKLDYQLYCYLKMFFDKSAWLIEKHSSLLIDLFITFDRENLLSLLKSAKSYSLHKKLKLCLDKNYIKEAVYLHTRMGQKQEALRLLIDQGGSEILCENPHATEEEIQEASVSATIEYLLEDDQTKMQSFRNTRQFTKARRFSHTQNELWMFVMSQAIDRPLLILSLLKYCGIEGLDATILIRLLKQEVEIPGIFDSIIRLIRDYQMQIDLRENSKNIVCSDFTKTMRSFLMQNQNGLKVAVNERTDSLLSCHICNKSIEPGNSHDRETGTPGSRKADDTKLVIFRCQHAYHEICIKNELNKERMLTGLEKLFTCCNDL